MGPDATLLHEWIGRTIEAEDTVTPRLIDSYRAMLAPHVAPSDGKAAPLALHWCLAPDVLETGQLGSDGHPAKGGFLPPVPLPRRMWAASDVRLLGSLAPEDRVRRRSKVAKIEEKQGQSGSLFFVTVRHELSNDAGPVIEENQIIVYREISGPAVSEASVPPSMPAAPHERKVEVDPVLLFRYSALTFNSHRIHYDYPYATGVEHYPGLVIHGPLQATLLLNFAAIVHARPPKDFSFRGTHPATGAQTLTLRATPDEAGSLALEVQSASGHVTMKATARW